MTKQFIIFFQNFQEFFCFILGLTIPCIYHMIIRLMNWIQKKFYFFKIYKYFLKEVLNKLTTLFNSIKDIDSVSLYVEKKIEDIKYYGFNEPNDECWKNKVKENNEKINHFLNGIKNLKQELKEQRDEIIADSSYLNDYQKSLLYAVKDIYAELLKDLENVDSCFTSCKIEYMDEIYNPYSYFDECIGDIVEDTEKNYIPQPEYLWEGIIIHNSEGDEENVSKKSGCIKLYAYDVLQNKINEIYSKDIKSLINTGKLHNFRKKRMITLNIYGRF